MTHGNSCVPVISTLLAGYASNATFADEILKRGGALHSYVALLQKWCAWSGPPNHMWNRCMIQSVFSSVECLGILSFKQAHEPFASCSASWAGVKNTLSFFHCKTERVFSAHCNVDIVFYFLHFLSEAVS
jgi:hypothetical protein